MNSGSFFAELKRRNVYKVAVAYAVIAWLLIQAASILFPTFEAPTWVMKVFVVIVAAGFPIALVIAWAFEMTPEGMKRTEDVRPDEKIPQWSRRKFAALILVITICAAGLLSYQLFRTKGQPAEPAIEAAPTSEQSIAVLPFENMSEDKANAFFASGIQDEILTRLAKINSLKVISRTSTQQYLSKPSSVGEIARQLGVANILEGSVQRVGNAVHINVQLIKAATDAHLWAESYNRKLDDIFAVEAEVATAIADQLNAKLTRSEKKELAQKATDNPAAYDAYLRGLTQFLQLGEEARNASIQSFEEAVRLDPKFALAWAALSRAHSVTYLQNLDRSAARSAAAEKSLAEAVRLQPQLAETQLARAWFQYCIRHDYKGAREILQQLRMIWPSNADIVSLMGYIFARMGDYQKATDYLDEAITLDPRDAFVRGQTIRTRVAMRDFAAALRLVDEALQIWPDDAILTINKAEILHGRGDLIEAQSAVDRILATQGDNPVPPALSEVAYQWKLRRTAPPAVILQQYEKMAAKSGSRISNIALANWADFLEFSGDKVGAQAAFARLRDSTEASLKQQSDNATMAGLRAYALAGLGEREAALSAVEQTLALTANDARQNGPIQELKARLLARFGDKDNAIPLLQHLLTTAYDGYYSAPLTPALLRLDPDFDPLRGDARFEKLCQDKPQ
jgi:TolB-like protein